MTELCEYNPKHKCAAFDPPQEGDCEMQAVISVGPWHLCQNCSGLPEFTKYRKRKVLLPGFAVNGPSEP